MKEKKTQSRKSLVKRPSKKAKHLPRNRRVTLAIPDLHYPFAHPDHLSFLKAVKAKYAPTDVVCLGDEVDFHAISDYDHDPDGLSAGGELTATLVELKKLYALFPVVKVCTSNHTSRPFRQALKHGIPSAVIKDYRDFLEAPIGWRWAESWDVNGVLFEHGEAFLGQLGAIKSALANGQSTVVGHIHAFAGILWNANPRHLIFGANSGCLIDKDAYAFAYGKKIKTKPVLGCTIVDGSVPAFVPMLLNKKGRWTGSL